MRWGSTVQDALEFFYVDVNGHNVLPFFVNLLRMSHSEGRQRSHPVFVDSNIALSVLFLQRKGTLLLKSGSDISLIIPNNRPRLRNACILASVWQYYHDMKDYQTAYFIARAFVKQDGSYAY